MEQITVIFKLQQFLHTPAQAIFFCVFGVFLCLALDFPGGMDSSEIALHSLFKH